MPIIYLMLFHVKDSYLSCLMWIISYEYYIQITIYPTLNVSNIQYDDGQFKANARRFANAKYLNIHMNNVTNMKN